MTGVDTYHTALEENQVNNGLGIHHRLVTGVYKDTGEQMRCRGATKEACSLNIHHIENQGESYSMKCLCIMSLHASERAQVMD